MNLLKTSFVVCAITFSMQSFAQPPAPAKSNDLAVTGNDVLIDLALRPVGLIATVAGAALYVGLSPFTAFSHAFHPHDSFQKVGKILVVNPARFTFNRPVGDYTHGSTY